MCGFIVYSYISKSVWDIEFFHTIQSPYIREFSFQANFGYFYFFFLFW